uniref:PDZ domain-containing protein n=1 Tax=Caenorhabditis tropicalis TaxID=1561998 RepID=A0A1I7U2L3_9PELO
MQEPPNPIDVKIHSSWDRPEFKKTEVETRVKELIKTQNLPVDAKLVVEATYEFPKKDRPSQLGIVNRHGLITRIHYASPFKGTLQPGDIIIQVNNQIVSFNEKTIMANVEEKTTSQQSKLNTQKRHDKNDKSGAPITQNPDFKTFVSKIMASKEPKITITAARLKTRNSNPSKLPAGFTASPGFKTDLAYLYQFKYLKLGLNMQQTGDKIVVNYTTPDTVSHITLNIGETILAVDDKPVTNLDDVRQRIMSGCNANGFAQLIVEYPMTDPMKNIVRGQLATASKTTDRPMYLMCGDVRKYCEEGLEALKNGKELEPIWKDSDGKVELEKKKSARKVTKKEKTFEFRNKTEEILIPSEWNSKLFVVLPPLKTKETEMRTDTSQIAKK